MIGGRGLAPQREALRWAAPRLALTVLAALAFAPVLSPAPAEAWWRGGWHGGGWGWHAGWHGGWVGHPGWGWQGGWCCARPYRPWWRPAVVVAPPRHVVAVPVPAYSVPAVVVP